MPHANDQRHQPQSPGTDAGRGPSPEPAPEPAPEHASERGSEPMSEPGHASVRRSYDAVAEEYRERIGGELAGKPLDRALLAALVEEVEAVAGIEGMAPGGRDAERDARTGPGGGATGPGAPVADLGCGPGHISGWLADHGVRAVGIDLSPAMVAIARREQPKAEFREGDLLRLPAADGEFAAAVAMYSVIHLEASELPAAFAEIRRVLRPSGLLLVAFHLGTEVRHWDQWWGHEVDVDFRFFEADTVLGPLRDAGFTVEAWLERAHYPHEAETRRGYVLARAGDRTPTAEPPAASAADGDVTLRAATSSS